MQTITNWARSIDLFAVPVSLNYKGKKKFSTVCGGVMSLLIFSIFTAYELMVMVDLIKQPTLSG